MTDVASLAKFFDLIVLLSCQNQTVMSLPIDAKRTAVTVARPLRAKMKCTEKQKLVQAIDVLATPHQSFDLAFVNLPRAHKSFFKIDAIQKLAIGAKVYSLQAVSENRKLKLNSAGLIETCEHTKRGLTQLESLPADERATHPDQDYGLKLWLRYCEFKGSKNVYSKVGTWKTYEVVSGTILWADETNFISTLPMGPAGAPVITEQGVLIGMQTALTPFKESELGARALSVTKVVSLKARELLRQAVKNGLWDY